ncbi:NADPH-dependent FMN reductase [Paraferrimonas sp. SM1919]|uniref:NADPH-dependent FMN reductase n=1 Tax=Paraferrimonas sp. SM1919 TaxID=2662263 RepID=UPI0013D1B9CC|nr:NAD(P)H-dependent oxidoreductase [Paraferrimonas sp. SM1919]
MSYLIVSSSPRDASQSAKVAQYLQQQLGSSAEHLELVQLNLPFWDGSDEAIAKPQWQQIKHKLKHAQGYIFITPEWNGIASPLLKNFLMMCDAQECAHKPTLLVSVVSGISGVHPINELKMNAFKNSRMLVLPDYLVIRHCEDALNHPKPQSSQDARTRSRIEYCLHLFKQYCQMLDHNKHRLSHPLANDFPYNP